MYEQHKIEEAFFFLSRLRSSVTQPKEFSFELSAFMSAARSVLQFAHNEAKDKPGGPVWYDSHMQNDIIKYFRDIRNISIHAKPVVPKLNINLSIGLTVPQIIPSIAVNLKVTDRDGNVIEEQNIPSVAPENKSEQPSSQSVTYSYSFDDWSGSEDVENLCHQYFAAIEAVVVDGRAKSFLSI